MAQSERDLAPIKPCALCFWRGLIALWVGFCYAGGVLEHEGGGPFV